MNLSLVHRGIGTTSLVDIPSADDVCATLIQWMKVFLAVTIFVFIQESDQVFFNEQPELHN